MAWTQPLAVLISFGIFVWTVGAAYVLLRGLVVPVDRAAVVALAVVGAAVAVAILVGRRSRRWTENPEHYW